MQVIINNKKIYKDLSIIGVASGWGAQIKGTEDGPHFFKNSFEKINIQHMRNEYKINWESTIFPDKLFKHVQRELPFAEREETIVKVCNVLKTQVQNTIKANKFPVIIGGDHSLAIGTWAGVAEAYKCYEYLGLIWIDAHMDSHTPQTSISKAIHGMPLAALMGYSSIKIKQMLERKIIINPKYLILIGIRSYEEEERIFLEKLAVKIYYIEEVLKKGISQVLKEAMEYLSNLTNFIGMSLDLDVFDPQYVPGTGSREANGLLPTDFLDTIKQYSLLKDLIAFEIMEYNPYLDQNSITLDLMLKIIIDGLQYDNCKRGSVFINV